jgi:stress response protein SCP2
MTAELVRGQNHPLSQVRLEIRVSAGTPIVAAAALSDENGRIHGREWVAHPGAPTQPGLEVSRQAAADHRLAVDLDAVPEAVHRVGVLLALPAAGAGPARFGAVAAPFVAVTGLDGAEIASYTITGLEAESAVVALELYRRQGAWKVRAVGQGYAGGLAELLTDQGLPEARRLAGSIDDAVAQGLARSVQAPPPRTADGDRSRQTAAPALGPDQGGTAPQPGQAPQMSPYGGQTPGGAGQPAPQTPSYPGAAPDPNAVTQPSTPTAGGPIDYSHPRRQNAAPPPPGV